MYKKPRVNPSRIISQRLAQNVERQAGHYAGESQQSTAAAITAQRRGVVTWAGGIKTSLKRRKAKAIIS